MTSRQKIKHNKNLYLKIALSAAVLIFATEAAVLFKTGSSGGILCLIFASAIFAKRSIATPGLSGTPTSVTRASCLAMAAPETAVSLSGV